MPFGQDVPFDDASYRRGLEAFRTGATARDIVMRAAAGEFDALGEEQVVSMAIGFLDGIIERLRVDRVVREANGE